MDILGRVEAKKFQVSDLEAIDVSAQTAMVMNTATTCQSSPKAANPLSYWAQPAKMI